MNRVASLLLGMVLGVPGLLSAGVDTAWVRRYDGPAHGEDWATRIVADSAGNVSVTGTSMSDTGQNSQYLYFVTIKYYPHGDTAWVRRQDFGSKDIPYGLGVDAQGNVYVTGTNNDSRMVTVKYGPTGNRLWYEFCGSQGGASDLVLDSRGNIIVCGSSYRASLDAATVKYRPNGDTAWARFYDWAGLEDLVTATACGQRDDIATTGDGATSTTHIDCITVRYDSTGDQLWAAGYDGPKHGVDAPNDLAACKNGDVVVTGFGDNGYGTPLDYLTIRYDSLGETLWTRRYDGPAHDWDEASAVAVDSDGSVYVTGYSYNASTKGDYTTIKYDSAGSVVWLRTYDGLSHNNDQAYGLALGDDGCVYVTGRSRGNGTQYDCATIRYGASGETLWTARYDGPFHGNDEATCMAINGRGDVAIAGFCDKYGGLDSMDMLVIKYVQNGGVAEQLAAPVASRLSLVVEPTVSNSRITLRYSIGSSASVRLLVFDAEGRRVRTLAGGGASAGANTAVWDGLDERGKRVPAGVYAIVLEADKERMFVKVVMSE